MKPKPPWKPKNPPSSSCTAATLEDLPSCESSLPLSLQKKSPTPIPHDDSPKTPIGLQFLGTHKNLSDLFLPRRFALISKTNDVFLWITSLRKAQTSLNSSKSLLCFWKFANRHQLSCIWVFHRVFVHVASQRWSLQTLPWPRTTSSHKSGKFSSFRPLSFYFVWILMFSSYFMSNFLSKFKLLSVVLCLGVLWWVMCLDSYKYLSSLLVVFHPTCLSSSIPMCLSLFIFLCLFVVVPSLMFTECSCSEQLSPVAVPTSQHGSSGTSTGCGDSANGQASSTPLYPPDTLSEVSISIFLPLPLLKRMHLLLKRTFQIQFHSTFP